MSANSLLIIFLSLLVSFDCKGVSENDEKKGRKLEKFIPLVAFKCGYRNKFLAEDGNWNNDVDKYATCLTGKLDILKYCRKVYPKLDVVNIVEYNHDVKISAWCHEEGIPCKWTHSVQPYRCLVGEFQSEALQVPQKCRFLHDSHSQTCKERDDWKEIATKRCASRVLENKEAILHSFAVLEPCGLDVFSGVEFVCCPSDKHNTDATIAEATIKKDAFHSNYENDDDDEDDDDDDDDYDDDYSENGDEILHAKDDSQDPYFKLSDPANEHERFKEAQQRLEKKHRAKINKVMREWNELEAKYQKMKKTDTNGAEIFKKEISSRFQKTVASLEEENKDEKKQLEDVHEERVQTHLNEKKRQATHDYRAALAMQVGTNNKFKVLRTLKVYIRSEEKDRMHMINRYRHLLRTDKEEADVYEPVLAHQLRYIDLRINGTLAMLRDFPELEKQVRPIALEFWREFRRDNTPEVTSDEYTEIGGDDVITKLIKYYKDSYNRLHPSSLKKKIKKLSATSISSLQNQKHESEKKKSTEVRENSGMKRIFEKVPEKVVIEKIIRRPANENEKDISSLLLTDNDEDDDEEEDEDESTELAKSREKEKELHVEIEPIANVPDRVLDLQVKPSYAKHSSLVHQKVDANYSYQPNIGVSMHMMIIAVASAVVVMVILGAVLIQKQSRHRGFIEVDVCTPEERHMNGLQINGYENPTYSFFDNKA